MLTYQIQPDVSNLWGTIYKVTKISRFEGDWKKLADDVGYKTEKGHRAFLARRNRLSPDFKLIMDILDSLYCDLVVLVPETKEEFESGQTVKTASRFMQQFLQLSEQDRELVAALLNRLSQKD